MGRGRRMILHLLLGALVAGVCLWWSVRDADWATLSARFSSAKYSSSPLMALLLVGFFALKAIRWQLLLVPICRPGLPAVTRPLLVGFMANNLLPAHLGELVRVHILGRTQQVSRASVLSTVVLERLFDLVTILGFLGAGLLADERLQKDYSEAVLSVAAVTGTILFLAVLFVCASETTVRVIAYLLSHWLRFVPEKWRLRLLELVRSAAAGLSALRHPRLAAGVVGTSVLQWLLMGLMVWVSLDTFGGSAVFWPSFVVVGVIAVLIIVPAPPGYVGPIQFCFIVVLGLYGVDKETALAASIYFHLWQFVPVTLAGWWCLQRLGLKWRDLKVEEDQLRDPSPDQVQSDSVGG